MQVSDLTFVPDGIEATLELAHAAGGAKDVGVWGGARVIRQCLTAGLLDQMQIHIIPIPLGEGTRLFEDFDPQRADLRKEGAIDTPAATHLRFDVVRRPA